MDGLAQRLRESIRLRLSLWLSAAILAVAIVAGAFSFISAFAEAHELQDDTLREVAALVDRHHLPLAAAPGKDQPAKESGEEESRVSIQYLSGGTAGGLAGPGAPLPLPPTLADGMHTIEIGGEPFRVLVKTTSTGERIAVAQETGVRDDIARNGALRTVMPFLVLVPILLLVVARLVREIFRPISSLAVEVDRRGERELHPLAHDGIPSEVRPFVTAINRMLKRVERNMAEQRRFIADAAHELRSPLTALSLQAERLASADMSDPARERLGALRHGIERSRAQLDQLLSLARAQSAPSASGAPVSVLQVYRSVLEGLMTMAEAKRLDIGVEGREDVRLQVAEVDLLALVKNLVDNAIRYTPADGRIDLSVAARGQEAVIEVRDSGPGIPPAERERVFDPFYRVLGSGELGSGLGLSIVKAVAERIGASIELAYANEADRSGLWVVVRIPIDGARP